MKRVRLDNREFVATYMNSTSMAEVAKNLGTTTGSASAKASSLRKLGVRLPKMKKPVADRALEVAQLNSLIKKHTK